MVRDSEEGEKAREREREMEDRESMDLYVREHMREIFREAVVYI